MGLFRIFKSKSDNVTQTAVLVNNENKKGISIEEARKLQSKFLSLLADGVSSKTQQMNAVHVMGLSGAYTEGIEAYQTLIEKYPEESATCESQIGALYFFMGDYERAIEHYIISKNDGFDKIMIDYNIWEACETLYKKTNEKSHLERYLHLCPDGEYIKKAKKLLEK